MTSSRLTVPLIAIGVFVLAVALLGGLFAAAGLYNVAADDPHMALTREIIGYTRERSIAVRASGIKVPPLNDPKMLSEGVEHYSAMCTGCHLAPGMGENEMRPGMNPKPPVFASLPRGNPAEQFWVIKHGIKMTGMPAWGVTHSDEEIWNMVAFLQTLPAMSPQQYRALVAASGTHHEHDEPMDMGH
jgi:mono/diheme cytochrome c family protein